MNNQYCYLGQDPSCDRINYIKSEQPPAFSIGPKFNAYNFSQTLTDSFNDLIVERLKQLRSKYAYLRLWFSGGKDSRIILDTAIKNNIKIDEILTIMYQPAGRFPIGAQVELETNAIAYLNEIALQKTKITIINFGPEHFNAAFCDPNWIHNNILHTLHSPFYPGLFFSKVNPEFQLVEKDKDVGDISGGTHPHVYYCNDCWTFYYVDLQFAFDSNGYTENFLAHDDMPELCHGFVRDLIKYNQHTNVTSLKASRLMRDTIPEYAVIQLPRPDLQLPKLYNGPWLPSKHYFWKTNQSWKTWINCLACYGQTPWNNAFDNYVNLTNWDDVSIAVDHPGIITKKYILA